MYKPVIDIIDIEISFLRYHSVAVLFLCSRSILTTPWVEMGGKVSISCAKTGYNATVTFHTKVGIHVSLENDLQNEWKWSMSYCR